MDYITFANGDQYECPFCAVNTHDGIAFVALANVTFAEAARIFSDPTKTAEFEYAGTTHTGFTELETVYVQPYGIQAMLKRSNA